MSDDADVDVIVVGAGPAGSACAHRLAREGRSVVLVERGTTAGAKNVSGGRLYTYALEALEEGLTRQAPFERAVVREQIMLVDGDRAMQVSVLPSGDSDPAGVPASVTVLRARFDAWLAGRAEGEGALLATGVTVDSLLMEHDRVVGIVADGEEMRASVVVAADGVSSLLAREAGLTGPLAPASVGVGVKEVVALDAAALEARFGVGPGEGAATLLLGCTGGVHGGGFMYTNAASISIGVVVSPGDLAAAGRTPHGLLQDLKEHPAVRPYLAGGESVEYSAHLVREDGVRGVPRRLAREGFLVTGEAAGFVLNLGYTVRGMDLALVSGIAAAEAVLAGGDLDAAYHAALERHGLMATMRGADGYRDLLHLHRLYGTYPGLALDVATSMFAVDGGPPPPLRRLVRDVRRRHGVPLRGLVRDGLVGVRSL
ncbi:FAD-dependent oxidoreductase [Actinotalea subterranea]|uniref:FAD-dependent oxidoreductase n=1 Tax=Actinotalea subterranea TaxID=2607497 RepID=UPI00165E9AE3|nr:FAD-dependent oxidoreductase [Actinotalea subterranea]